jgi:hypothetical protein
MTYRKSAHLFALGCLLLCMLGCEATPEPQKIGVFASTNHGLLELTAYGEQSSMTNYDLSKLHDVPTVAKITSLYVNMPDSKITNSKIFWLTKLDKGFDEKSQPSLNASIEAGKNNVYQIKCAELEGKSGGDILLKISMPLGTPDRMYVIRLSE